MKEELKPCPFCGCEASREFFSTGGNGWSIFCDGCHASSATCDLKADAERAWNTRALAKEK
jgi:Lar family restriction alleviation protein